MTALDPRVQRHASSMVSQPARAAFRWEAEMAPPVAAAANVLMGGLPGRGRPEVLFEVPTAAGIPDVLALRWRIVAVRRRLTRGLGPVEDFTCVRVLTLLEGKSMSVDKLAYGSGVTASHLRRTVIPRLAAGGWVEELKPRRDRGSGALVHSLATHEPLGAQIVTVETKRSNWRQAFAQARRHRAAADACYIALDQARAGAALRYARDFAKAGVGLITVDALTGKTFMVSRPATFGARHDADRRLIAERAWALMLAGRTTGTTYPVFGRNLIGPSVL